MVHLLPHERIDLYMEAVTKMKNMALAIDHKNCEKFFKSDAAKKCLWPKYHRDKKSYLEEGKIRDMAILDKHGVEAAGLSILTRRKPESALSELGRILRRNLMRDFSIWLGSSQLGCRMRFTVLKARLS